MTIDPDAYYQIKGSDLLNCIEQAGYVHAALTNQENLHLTIPWGLIHNPLNHLALIAAWSLGLSSDTFCGSGTVTSSSTNSGGTAK